LNEINLSNITGTSANTISDILERFKKEFPDELRMAFKEHDHLFAKYGWYIYDGSSVEEVLIILKLFNQGRSDLAIVELEKNIESNLDEIEVDLTRFNENSNHIIREAIECHRKGLYFASTILFLSITDGLAEGKLFGKGFFDKIKRHNSKHFLLDIFNNENPVHQKYVPKKSSSAELMRHGIMHGNSTNYGSKINSLKALSLLHYISSRKHELKN